MELEREERERLELEANLVAVYRSFCMLDDARANKLVSDVEYSAERKSLILAFRTFRDGFLTVGDGTVAIGSTSEHAWTDPTATDSQLDTLIARACAAVPALQGAPVLDRWAALRPRARSRAPVLGEWPGRLGHFIANGGFKIGFGMAPKVAQVMVDLVLEGRDSIRDDFRVSAL